MEAGPFLHCRVCTCMKTDCSFYIYMCEYAVETYETLSGSMHENEEPYLCILS